MSKPIALHVALADCGSGVQAEDVWNFIESRGQGFETYQLDARRVSHAAIEYIVLLGAAGSVASLAALLWMAYDKYIASKKTPDDAAGIYLAIRKPDGSVVDFWIGKGYQDRDVFIGEFTRTISDFRSSAKADSDFEKTEQEVRLSGLWIRRK